MVSATVVVELLSPVTEKEDLGQSTRLTSQPPTKWEVYEQILKVPYYITFDRYTNDIKFFVLTGGFYQAMQLTEPKIKIPQFELSLGLWSGEYEGINRVWLRWYDTSDKLILTPTEEKALIQEKLETERQRAETERQRAETERLRSQHLEKILRDRGIDPDNLS